MEDPDIPLLMQYAVHLAIPTTQNTTRPTLGKRP